MALPIKLPLDQMQVKWKSQIDPVLSNQILQGQLIEGINLINGATTISHKLGRKLVGWIVVGISASAVVHDSQSLNPAQDTSLILVSTAPAMANIWVF